jgi:alpha-tubulin suppressor-like RCC1 family protein
VLVTGRTDGLTSSGDAFHRCATTQTGHAWCWGRNNFGQLGNGTTTDSNVPVPVSPIPAP